MSSTDELDLLIEIQTKRSACIAAQEEDRHDDPAVAEWQEMRTYWRKIREYVAAIDAPGLATPETITTAIEEV